MKLITLALSALLCAPLLQAQSVPGAMVGRPWELFAGGSAIVTSSGHNFGWNSSVTEYPYPSLPWFGGTIEGSGHYESHTLTYSGVTFNAHSSLHTVMGGPTASFHWGRIRPFVHALFGAAIQNSTMNVSLGGLNSSAQISANSFSMAAGGGVDLPLSSRFALRTQCDWLRAGADTASNSVRPSAGLVARF